MSSIVPVVLSGGVGTRLWPLSRRTKPKQFQTLIGSQSMLAETLARVAKLGSEPLLIGSLTSVPELASYENVRVLAEPVARNTAPAVAAAALSLDPADIMIVMPADHHVADESAFEAALQGATLAAKEGYLTTFGIVPDRPETGYGYIVPGEIEGATQLVGTFVEKPDLETATHLIDEGALWNSGIFAFPVATLLAELDRFEPELLAAVRASVEASVLHPWGHELGAAFARAPDISIDVAVMERTDKAAMVPLAAGWSDVGSWESLWELGEKDSRGNVVQGPVTLLDSAENYVRSDGPTIAVSGVEGLVVVATAAAVLVTKRESAQAVKELYELLDPEDR